jgi:hypothetical protein
VREPPGPCGLEPPVCGSKPPACGSKPPACGSKPPVPRGEPPVCGSKPPVCGSKPPVQRGGAAGVGCEPPVPRGEPPALGLEPPVCVEEPPAESTYDLGGQSTYAVDVVCKNSNATKSPSAVVGHLGGSLCRAHPWPTIATWFWSVWMGLFWFPSFSFAPLGSWVACFPFWALSFARPFV